MNPEQANTVVIRGKKSDGLEALAQTAFLKVVTFVGLYLYKLCVVFSPAEFVFCSAKLKL